VFVSGRGRTRPGVTDGRDRTETAAAVDGGTDYAALRTNGSTDESFLTEDRIGTETETKTFAGNADCRIGT